MTIKEYLPTVQLPLRQSTLVFLRKDDMVLLAMKKRGFGAGHWNGVGGKVEEGESVAEAARRETIEEIGVVPNALIEVATLNFYFPYVDASKKFDQQVRVFTCTSWDGDPQESDEMCPEWFLESTIPYDQMWSDDILWLPHVLEGSYVTADVLFDDAQAVEDHAMVFS